MIVTTDSGSAAVILGPGGMCVRVRCLARRDMLHSACASFDHVRLSPGARYEAAGRTDSEVAWYVLRGPLLVERCPEQPQYLAADRDLLLVPLGVDLRLQAGPLGAEALCLTLAPAAPRAAPPRRADRRGGGGRVGGGHGRGSTRP